MHLRVAGKNRTVVITRVSWEIKHGQIPMGMMVRRRPECRTAWCANPSHLHLVHIKKYMSELMERIRAAAVGANQGVKHHKAKLDDEKIIAIRADAAAGMTLGAIGSKYGIARSTASRIVAGKAWSHVKPNKSTESK